MPAIRCLLIAMAVCSSVVAGNAQQNDITIDTKATPKDIQKWLNSNDPRLIAWGAYFARENSDTESVAPMLRFVEGWTPPEKDKNTFERPRLDAMREVLDALIVRKEKVPPQGLISIASSFPRQAAILASRLPVSETAPLLLVWYNNRNREDNKAIPRIAAMMLSKAPPPGFAATVLAESEEELQVTVENPLGIGFGYGWGSSGGCGDGWGILSPEGWPPLFDYGLEENAPGTKEAVVVEAGGDRITYYRILLSKNWGSCSFVRPLAAETRYHLLVEMLRVSEKNLPWKVQKDAWIYWESKEQFGSELQRLVTAEEAKLHATAEAFCAEKLLTREEADSVRPMLSITVFDYRRPAGKPLPRLKLGDSRTTITYKQP